MAPFERYDPSEAFAQQYGEKGYDPEHSLAGEGDDPTIEDVEQLLREDAQSIVTPHYIDTEKVIGDFMDRLQKDTASNVSDNAPDQQEK